MNLAELENLSLSETRVLGCLIEKEMTTPDYYPMTLNALVAACNQKSNRDPVLGLTESEVMHALDELRERQLVWEVSVQGSRVPKYKHRVIEQFAFSPRQAAVMGELLLRGPQTPGALRSRCSRMVAVDNLAEIQEVLRELRDAERGPFVAILPREAGKREQRWLQLLGGDAPSDVDVQTEEGAQAADSAAPSSSGVPASSNREELRERLERLEKDVRTLTERFEEFVRQFG